MVTRLEINTENLVEAIHFVKLLPQEMEDAMRYAQLQAGKYARQQSRRTFRERTRIRRTSRARRRTSGSKARAWLGGNRIPVKNIAGLVTHRKGKIETEASKRRRAAAPQNVGGRGKKTQRTTVTREKVYIDNKYYPEFFPLNTVPGKPIYRRLPAGEGAGGRKLEIVYWGIAEQTHQAAEDVLPGTYQRLQDAFLEKANQTLETSIPTEGLGTHKGSVEDRLSFIKYFRTNLR